MVSTEAANILVMSDVHWQIETRQPNNSKQFRFDLFRCFAVSAVSV